MLAKLILALAVVAAFAAPAAAGDGPLFVSQGGVGIAAGSTRYLPVPSYQSDNTILLSLSTTDATERNQMELVGQWGLPSTPSGADGLSRDGTRLVLSDVSAGQTSPSLFMIVNPKTMKIVDTITLTGWYSFDAMSPDGTKLYFIDYVQGANSGDLEHYVVRAYDLRTNRLLPGRIADRTQKSWVMQGSPVARTKSADGRWVYTLYMNPGGYPFIHALDTVRGVAHCVGLPLQNQNGIGNLVLGLHGRTLAVHWRSGRPFVNVDTASWRVSPAHRGGFDWWWTSLAALPLAAAGILLAARRRRHRAAELDAALADMLREAEPAVR
ncbi:MAG: YncE family protein [Gaiellaceae bacterium]